MTEGWKEEDMIDENTETIEGIIYKVGGLWVAVFLSPEGKTLRCQVDYNPWTGEKLR